VALGTAFRLAGGAAGARSPRDPALPIIDDVSMGGGDHGLDAPAIHPELPAHFAEGTINSADEAGEDEFGLRLAAKAADREKAAGLGQRRVR
jgi:hypothetical protein